MIRLECCSPLIATLKESRSVERSEVGRLNGQ